MLSLQTISACLQQLVESPTSRHRARRSAHSKWPQKSSKIYTPFSPRIAFLEPMDYDRDTTPLLNVSRSNTPSMLSAVTSTGAYSLTDTPSTLSSVSFAKSETYLPVLPALPFNLHHNKSEPSGDYQTEAKPSVIGHEAVSHRLDSSREVFRLPEYAVDEEAAVSTVQAVPRLIPKPPKPTERGVRKGQSTGPTAYRFSNYQESPNPPFGSRVEKDEHEIYLDKLRLLRFEGITQSSGIGDNSLSEGFPIVQQEDDDDTASWEEIDLRDYGWQV